jgi:cell wall-associated NlpC family hydrolase
VLYGTRSGSGDIVEVAVSQLGNPGGAPYWSWYGFSGRVEWCACFVSWCANECGYIEAGSIPRFSWVPSGVQWFRDARRFQERGYSPQPGDIIFFDWQGDGESDHVGIVEYVGGGYVHTIEGNSSDTVNRRTYSISSSVIVGYGLISQ